MGKILFVRGVAVEKGSTIANPLYLLNRQRYELLATDTDNVSKILTAVTINDTLTS